MHTSAAARLIEMNDADVGAVHLAAQVMRHKAGSAGQPLVSAWFAWLEAAARAELERRRSGAPALPAERRPLALVGTDRALVADYVALLSDNGRLPPKVRAFWRALSAAPAD